jgi:DNA-binding NarL/FixJ family response regulator
MTNQRFQDNRRVLVLDSQPVWLRAVEGILRDAGYTVASAAAAGRALVLLRRDPAAVVMLGIDGVREWEHILETIRRRKAPPKVIVVAGSNDRALVERALKLGADAFVGKRALPEDIAFAVRQVLEPEVYEVRPTAPRSAAPRSRGSGRPVGLTPREHQILQLLALGQSNAEIARRLSISEPTVKGHLWRLYRKIGVANRTAAARWVTRAQPLESD